MSNINFKSYGELEISENLSESSHVLIEENGDVKRYPADGIGGGVTSWNDLEDKPFGSVREEIAVAYDEANANNVTLASGQVLYYISDYQNDNTYDNFSTKFFYVVEGHKEYDLNERIQYIPAKDTDNFDAEVICYRFMEVVFDPTFVMYDVVLFYNWYPYGSVTFEYEGETITLNSVGYYATKPNNDYYLEKLYGEKIERIQKKFLPSTVVMEEKLFDNIDSSKVTFMMTGSSVSNKYEIADSQFEKVYDVLNYGMCNRSFSGWANIDGIMVAIMEIHRGSSYEGDKRHIYFAPYGYEIGKKYFQWSEDDEVTLIEVD